MLMYAYVFNLPMEVRGLIEVRGYFVPGRVGIWAWPTGNLLGRRHRRRRRRPRRRRRRGPLRARPRARAILTRYG